MKKLKPPVQDVLGSEKAAEISKENDKSNEINSPPSVQEQPESVSESPRGNSTEISKSHRFKCSECSKTFDKKHLRQRCEWKHKVIKSERYKCETCGKVGKMCSVEPCFCKILIQLLLQLCCSKFNLTRHELTHKNEQQQPKSGGDLPSSEENKSMVHYAFDLLTPNPLFEGIFILFPTLKISKK